MRELLNVLYVQTQDAVLRLDHDAIRVEVEHEIRLRAPLIRIGAIVMFGQVSVTASLLQRCAEDGRSVVWLDRRGRFRARVEGITRGNVLLRRAQHLALSDRLRTTSLARQIVAAKIQNSRGVLLRGARDAATDEDRQSLAQGASDLVGILGRLKDTVHLDIVRGYEGDAARTYFRAFPMLVRADRATFGPGGRSRRPPRDRVNAVLSFTYALLRAECTAALEGVGLDPQVGFLHALRPGRPSLALDLMEELRAPLADRLTLALVNRRQLQAEHFELLPGDAVQLTEAGRRILLTSYQQRKEELVEHRVLREKIPYGLVPHIQARLLARHLRGDLQEYPPFIAR
jgi:CRISPR-associated protein Cas1